MEAQNKQKHAVRKGVFFVPWLLIVVTVIINFVNGEVFNNAIMVANTFIMDKFSWLFALMAFFCVLLVIFAYVMPFGRVRIGGRKMKPMMKKQNYVFIVLCTMLAAGILLWACAEPMLHYYTPPASVEGETTSAQIFGMRELFLEWSFTPMCIYAMPALLFAFLFYNAKKSFSIGNMLYPALPMPKAEKASPFIDGVSLFALVCGMSASMGSAVFLLSDGFESLTKGGITSTPKVWVIMGAAIVAAFVASAVSGIMKGIRILSTINSRIYFALGLFVFIFGPTFYMLNLTVESFGAYLTNFCEHSLFLSAADGDKWAMWWPIFYWCNWMAWMPVTATFLGRISKGFTVRESIRVTVLWPSVFSICWLGLFSSASYYYEFAGKGIWEAMGMSSATPAKATYAVFHQMPIPMVTITVFLIIVFISFVTASDSNTNAMSGICTSGLTADDAESPTWLKVVWGCTIGVVCLVFLNAFRSTDALKYLSNLGGFPIVFFMIFIAISFVKVVLNPQKYDVHKEDYDENGKPIPSERLLSEQEEAELAKKGDKTETAA